MNTETSQKWFCLRAKPKCEHLAAAGLRRLDGVEVFCPRIRFRRATTRGRVWFNEALFPGYLFARFDQGLLLRAVRYAHGVSGLVQFGARYAEVPSETLDALRDRDVLQSLLTASVLGSAAEGLALLGSGQTPTTRTLSGLARDRLDDVVASADLLSSAEVVRAVAAVLPVGFADADPRRAVIARLVGPDAEQQAIFRGIPY